MQDLTRFRRPMTNDIKPTINPLVHSHSLIPNHLHYGHCASSWNRPHTNTCEVWSLTVSQFNLCKVVIIDRQNGGKDFVVLSRKSKQEEPITLL